VLRLGAGDAGAQRIGTGPRRGDGHTPPTNARAALRRSARVAGRLRAVTVVAGFAPYDTTLTSPRCRSTSVISRWS
jgi:hypothetical protein